MPIAHYIDHKRKLVVARGTGVFTESDAFGFARIPAPGGAPAEVTVRASREGYRPASRRGRLLGEHAVELKLLKAWLDLSNGIAALKKQVREGEAALDTLAYEQYPKLSQVEIQSLVIDDKWMATLAATVQGELDRVSQTPNGRIRELAERYATPLPQLTNEVAGLAAKVGSHLTKMGVA